MFPPLLTPQHPKNPELGLTKIIFGLLQWKYYSPLGMKTSSLKV